MTHRTWLLLVMSACFACVAFDNTKLVALLPTLARQASASPNLLRWIVEANLLVYAGLLLLGGSLSERFGVRPVLLLGLCVFGCASLAGALSTSLLALLAARAALGAGAACMTPATLAALKHAFPGEERAGAIAVWTASFGLGAAAGPLATGFLLEWFGAPAVLLGNLPLALGCAFGAWRLLPGDSPRRGLPLDWGGAGLCLLTVSCLMFAILTGPARGWLTPEVLVALLLAGGACGSAWLWLRRAAHPLLDLQLLSDVGFARALLLVLLGYFAFSGVSFVLAPYLQLACEQSPLVAGLLSLPSPLALLVGTLLAPVVSSRLGAESALRWSLALALLGSLLLTAATRHVRTLFFCGALVPFGSGCGSAFATATELTLARAAPERAATAAALSETAFELGGALGVAVLSTILTGSALSHDSIALTTPRALWVAVTALAIALFVAARSEPVSRR
jgi:DHA2 family multidrug resistance protein-like MFS transporter